MGEKTLSGLRKSIRHQLQLIHFLRSYLPVSRKHWTEDAFVQIQKMDMFTKQEKDRIYKDYCKNYDKYRVKFSEYYFGYNFPHLSEKEKKTYLSMRDLQIILKKYDYLYPRQREITGNKSVFLQEFRDYFHRDWMLVNSDTNAETVQAFLNAHDTIVKPIDSCGGKGVYKLLRGQGNAVSVLSGSLPVLLEECVQNVPELAAFHPASLNTIRITTVTNGKEVKFLGACFRTGNNNSVFDNADAGGIFAEIDLDTGKLISDGVSEKGDRFPAHPATGIRFLETQIPNWAEVKDLCVRAALHLPDSYIIAWDIAITTKGLEIIEGNSIPSVEIHQIPLNKGIRKRLLSIFQQLGMQYRDVLCMLFVFNNLYRLYVSIRFRNKKQSFAERT